MYILLYPNKSGQKNYAKSGSIITNALKNSCEQLLASDSITHYKIQRFKVDEYNYPELSDSELKSPCILDYLKSSSTDTCDSINENGTGDDLTGVIGCHTIIHDYDCTTGNVAAGGGSEDCTDGSAFSQARTAWTSVNCRDDSLTRSSVIQEPLHQYILASDPDFQDLVSDCDNDGEITYREEHALGKIWPSDREVSPLLTYHADEEEFNCGDCKTGSLYSGWDQRLTQCTKDAVRSLAKDPCDSKTC